MRAKFTPHKTKEYQLSDLCIIIFKFNLIEDIRILGKDRLKALHIHDVGYCEDTHIAPYMLKIDWDEVLRALKEIGYDGDFTFEAVNLFKGFPIELLQDTMEFLCKIGRYSSNEEDAKDV